MAELLDAEELIMDRLSLVADGRRYSGIAPIGTPEPYVIVQVQSPGVDIEGFGGRIASNPLFIVKAVARTGSWLPLKPIADTIDAQLRFINGVTAGGKSISVFREGAFSLIETNGEEQYRHLGGRYRVLIGA